MLFSTVLMTPTQPESNWLSRTAISWVDWTHNSGNATRSDLRSIHTSISLEIASQETNSIISNWPDIPRYILKPNLFYDSSILTLVIYSLLLIHYPALHKAAWWRNTCSPWASRGWVERRLTSDSDYLTNSFKNSALS